MTEVRYGGRGILCEEKNVNSKQITASCIFPQLSLYDVLETTELQE